MAKSSIIFGKKVQASQRLCIQNILQIHRLGGEGKYLGLPEQFSSSKVNDFQGLVDQVKARVSPWYNQYLSQAGKEVLIKSVLQSKPVFSMSCYLLPKTICDDINSVLSEFWWGKNDDKKKISWVSWKRLCLPKKEGGMGFRDLHSFNKALLAKQAWRLVNNPNSLLYRLYKGRYFHSTTFLQSSNITQSSYGWKSIQAGKELIQKGMRTLIADGRLTSVWYDRWLPSLPPRCLQYPTTNPDMKVSDLMNNDQRS